MIFKPPSTYVLLMTGWLEMSTGWLSSHLVYMLKKALLSLTSLYVALRDELFVLLCRGIRLLLRSWPVSFSPQTTRISHTSHPPFSRSSTPLICDYWPIRCHGMPPPFSNVVSFAHLNASLLYWVLSRHCSQVTYTLYPYALFLIFE